MSAAAIAFFPLKTVGTAGHYARWLIWKHARATDGQIEKSTGCQRGIADDFRIKSYAALPSEKAVLRIGDLQLLPRARTLPIRRRSYNQAMDVLQMPTMIHQLGSQPIKKFGVRRRRRLYAKIIAGFDNAGAKVVLPDSIHRHTRYQR